MATDRTVKCVIIRSTAGVEKKQYPSWADAEYVFRRSGRALERCWCSAITFGWPESKLFTTTNIRFSPERKPLPPRKYSSAAAPVRFPFKAGPSPPPGPEEDNTESIPPLEPIFQAIQPPQRVPPQRVLQPIQPPQKPSVGVPPKLEEKGANAYEVGARVEVWSKGAQAWCPATVDHLEGPMVFVKYRIPTGATMMKGIPYFHSTIRHASIA